MINVCTNIIGYFGIGKMSLFYWRVVCCQNVSHPAGNMPAMVCLVQG